MNVGYWYNVDSSPLRLIEKGRKNYTFVSVGGMKVKLNPHKKKIEFLHDPSDKETNEALKSKILEKLESRQ